MDRNKQSELSTLARLLRANGAYVERSPSGTVYVGRSGCRLRLADHELGYADYGNREQRHRGPELVLAGDESEAAALRSAADEIRRWARDYADGYGRKNAAESLGAIRRLLRKMADPGWQARRERAALARAKVANRRDDLRRACGLPWNCRWSAARMIDWAVARDDEQRAACERFSAGKALADLRNSNARETELRRLHWAWCFKGRPDGLRAELVRQGVCVG